MNGGPCERMKLGIVSQSKLLTVFIRENLTKGWFTKVGDIKVTHGKLWGHLVCLLESEGEKDFAASDITELLAEHKVSQLLSLGIVRRVQPMLATGDFIVSSEALLCNYDPKEGLRFSQPIEASPKLLDKVLNSFERYPSDELGSRAIVGRVISCPDTGLKGYEYGDINDSTIQCWDKDGYYLAEYCSCSGIPWALVRVLCQEDLQNKVTPVQKWDMAKKCFWIVKGVLERSKISKYKKTVW